MKGKEEKRGDPKDNLWGSPRRGESQKDPPGGLDGGEEREKERGMERWRGTQLGQILPQILPKERETLRRTPGGPRDPGSPRENPKGNPKEQHHTVPTLIGSRGEASKAQCQGTAATYTQPYR